jgi:hypothetical protein
LQKCLLVFQYIYSSWERIQMLSILQDLQLKNVVLAELSNDEFLRQIAKSEFEQDLRFVVDKISKDVEIDTSYKTELKKKGVEKVIRDVRKEFENRRYKSS